MSRLEPSSSPRKLPPMFLALTLAVGLGVGCGPGLQGPSDFSLGAVTPASDAGGPDAGPGARTSIHTSLGLPDTSTADPANPGHYLSVKRDYVISYDSARRVPNWTSWELNSAWLGATVRQNTFRPDDTLPVGLPQAQLADYTGSGYDRGHLCPSADRTDSVQDNSDTFYLSNMVPQAHNSNAGPWELLENYERSLASAGKELFIVAGGLYGATSRTVGPDQVSVPDSTFKVIVVLDRPGQGPQDVTPSTRVIAVVMPNDNAAVSLTSDWKPFRVSARSIEQQTGLDFLSEVPRSIQDALETSVDAQ